MRLEIPTSSQQKILSLRRLIKEKRRLVKKKIEELDDYVDAMVEEINVLLNESNEGLKELKEELEPLLEGWNDTLAEIEERDGEAPDEAYLFVEEWETIHERHPDGTLDFHSFLEEFDNVIWYTVNEWELFEIPDLEWEGSDPIYKGDQE